jgi:hypothetical protein
MEGTRQKERRIDLTVLAHKRKIGRLDTKNRGSGLARDSGSAFNEGVD